MPAIHTHVIELRGRVGAHVLGPLLDDFTVDHSVAHRTRLAGTVRDASHLHGVVAYLASINAELISLTPIAVDLGATPITVTSGPDTRIDHETPHDNSHTDNHRSTR